MPWNAQSIPGEAGVRLLWLLLLLLLLLVVVVVRGWRRWRGRTDSDSCPLSSPLSWTKHSVVAVVGRG